MEKNITCIGVKCYNHDTHEIYEKDFNEHCSNFDIYPTIISHKNRIIAIGDIHGDMNLAINFLKTAKLIEEILNPTEKFAYAFATSNVKEYIYKLKIKNTNAVELVEEQTEPDLNMNYEQISKHVKNEIEVVYRYYKIDNEYYVKIVQEDNNPNLTNKSRSYGIFYDPNRWFKWIGEQTYVVQVGDQIDRCRPYEGHVCKDITTTPNDEDSDLEIMLFYDSLDHIAKKAGGRVLSLLGNHEIMNVMGDMRYVSNKGLREYSPEPKNINDGLQIRKNKFASIMSKRMACTRSTVLVIGDYLFVHGGIANKLAYKYNLIDINSIIRKFLYGSLKYQEDLKQLLNSSKFSPLWYRKLAYIPPDINGVENKQCKTIYNHVIKQINDTNSDQIISTQPVIQLKGMVIGHTPQFTVFGKGITTACSDRIIRTDIGASSAFDYFAKEMNNAKIDEARKPQVVEIITNIITKESSVQILHYENLQ